MKTDQSPASSYTGVFYLPSGYWLLQGRQCCLPAFPCYLHLILFAYHSCDTKEIHL